MRTPPGSVFFWGPDSLGVRVGSIGGAYRVVTTASRCRHAFIKDCASGGVAGRCIGLRRGGVVLAPQRYCRNDEVRDWDRRS